MNKLHSQVESSIGFFLQINPKFSLRKTLRKKIQNFVKWLDLDEEDTNSLYKRITDKTLSFSQEIVILAFDIYNRDICSGTGTIRITSFVNEIENSPNDASVLKIILCNASRLDNNPQILFIPYRIQGITRQSSPNHKNSKPTTPSSLHMT